MLMKAPSPRNRLNTLRAFRGVMRFSPETREFLVFRIALGARNEKGFIPIEEDPGHYTMGVIYLKDAEEPGYYPVYPKDLFRRRLHARSDRRLSREAAMQLLGADPSEFPEFSVGTTTDEPGAGVDASPEELQAINLLVQEQEAAILDLETAKAT